MISYIKTIHSHTTAEIFKKSVFSNASIKAGTVCQLINGYLAHQNNSTLPRYLVIEEKTPTDNKAYVDCIRLVPGMILKGNHDFGSTTVNEGTLCSFGADYDETYTYISLSGSDAEVLKVEGDIATILIN